jgi:hypothetical protein
MCSTEGGLDQRGDAIADELNKGEGRDSKTTANNKTTLLRNIRRPRLFVYRLPVMKSHTPVVFFPSDSPLWMLLACVMAR